MSVILPGNSNLSAATPAVRPTTNPSAAPDAAPAAPPDPTLSSASTPSSAVTGAAVGDKKAALVAAVSGPTTAPTAPPKPAAPLLAPPPASLTGSLGSASATLTLQAGMPSSQSQMGLSGGASATPSGLTLQGGASQQSMLTLPFQGTLNATVPGFTLNGTGQGQLQTGTALNLQGAAQMGPGGLSLQGSQQANVGQFGSGSFQGTANLPLGLTANVQANGPFVNGLQSSGSGALSIGPNGVNGTLQSNTILGAQAQGQVSASIPLGGGYQVDTTLSGQALAGVRAGTGNASLFAPGNGPGQGSQAGTLQLNGTTANVDLGASSFAGLEAQVTSDTALQTPYGTARSVTNLRAADGVGGSGALKFVSNPNEITIGAGGAFEAGPSVGLRQDQILQLKDGSSLQTTGIVSAGGTSAEGQFLFSRNNTDRTTQLGALLAVPIPETPLTAGGGINLKVTDSTLQDGARLLGGPILGDTYAQAVTPTMDTLPVIGNALYQSNPIVLAAQHPEALTAAATLPTALVGVALDNAPQAAQTILNASTALPAAAVGAAVQNAPQAAQVALNVAVAPAAMVADGIENVQTAGKVAYSAYQLLKPSWMP